MDSGRRNMYQKRQIALIELLIMSDQPITGSQLAKNLGVSSRTIRTDIDSIQSMIKDQNISIKAMNPKGYYIQSLEKEFFKKIIEDFKSNQKKNILPQTPSERMTFILIDLLLHGKQSMQVLSDILYVTKTTINTDVNRLNESLSEGLAENLIVSDVEGIQLTGYEFEIRKRAASWIVRNQDRMNPLIQSLEVFEPQIDFVKKTVSIYQTLISIIEEHEVYLADKEVVYLMMFLMFSYLRKQHYPLSFKFQFNSLKWVNDVIHQTEKTLGITWTEDEVNTIRGFCDSLSLVSSEMVQQDNKEIIQLINLFLEKVEHAYGIDLKENESLKHFLYVHIRSLFYRLELNEFEYNPLKDDIKKKFPLATEISLLFYNLVKNEKRLMMNDSEISYIALHVASALEILIEPSELILVSNLGQGPTRLLATKLIHFFTNKIVLKHTYSIYQYEKAIETNGFDCDLVVSTSPLNSYQSIPVIVVNPLLFRDDLAHLKRYINFYSTEMKNHDRFSELFDERLYFKAQAENNSYLAIVRLLVRHLKTFDYIEDEDEYYELILEREKTFSTIMDNGIAIPHAAENRSRKTVIAVAVLDEPLIHEGKKVSLILLNAINEKEDLQNLYQMIERVLSLDNIQDALNALNLKEFIEIISQKEAK